jgi:hypothetical protein
VSYSPPRWRREQLPRGVIRFFPTHVEKTDEEELMTEPEHVTAALPKLDCMDDPRGGAVTWALLVVVVTLVAGILLAATWVAGAA